MKTMKLKDWEKEGEKLFGKDKKKWKFKCVSCGNVQTGEDFRKIDVDPNGHVHFSCIGRWKKDVKCNWTLGGFLTMHKLEIIGEDGKGHACFEFAKD